MSNYYRLLDANINRASEAARLLEDYARFCIKDRPVQARLRQFRHSMRKKLSFMDSALLANRDPVNDCGTITSHFSSIDNKSSGMQMAVGNFKRIQEAVRTIEETLKIMKLYEESKEFEKIRFDSYQIEKEYIVLIRKNIPRGLYGIISAKPSSGAGTIEAAVQMADAGIGIIQYSADKISRGVMLSECAKIREITKERGAVFIIRDHADICLITDADGVHLEQDGLPADSARLILGSRIIGVSVHSEKQARDAQKKGADYISAGPLFETGIKEAVCIKEGFQCLEFALKGISIPCIASGGINEGNIGAVLRTGAERFEIVSDIWGPGGIRENIKMLQVIIDQYSGID